VATVNPNSKNYSEMEERAFLLGTSSGTHCTSALGQGQPGHDVRRYYDAPTPTLVATSGKRSKAATTAMHKDLLVDAASPRCVPRTRQSHVPSGRSAEVQNVYPRLHAQGFFEGLREVVRAGPVTVPLGVGRQPALGVAFGR